MRMTKVWLLTACLGFTLTVECLLRASAVPVAVETSVSAGLYGGNIGPSCQATNSGANYNYRQGCGTTNPQPVGTPDEPKQNPLRALETNDALREHRLGLHDRFAIRHQRG